LRRALRHGMVGVRGEGSSPRGVRRSDPRYTLYREVDQVGVLLG
jgi:hypothetical protein